MLAIVSLQVIVTSRAQVAESLSNLGRCVVSQLYRVTIIAWRTHPTAELLGLYLGPIQHTRVKQFAMGTELEAFVQAHCPSAGHEGASRMS